MKERERRRERREKQQKHRRRKRECLALPNAGHHALQLVDESGSLKTTTLLCTQNSPTTSTLPLPSVDGASRFASYIIMSDKEFGGEWLTWHLRRTCSQRDMLTRSR